MIINASDSHVEYDSTNKKLIFKERESQHDIVSVGELANAAIITYRVTINAGGCQPHDNVEIYGTIRKDTRGISGYTALGYVNIRCTPFSPLVTAPSIYVRDLGESFSVSGWLASELDDYETLSVDVDVLMVKTAP